MISFFPPFFSFFKGFRLGLRRLWRYLQAAQKGFALAFFHSPEKLVSRASANLREIYYEWKT
jgi:hypothetical protein